MNPVPKKKKGNHRLDGLQGVASFSVGQQQDKATGLPAILLLRACGTQGMASICGYVPWKKYNMSGSDTFPLKPTWENNKCS